MCGMIVEVQFMVDDGVIDMIQFEEVFECPCPFLM